MRPPAVPSRSSISTRSALLRHTLPDGSWHFDWLIERPTPHVEHRLIAFRLDPPTDPDQHPPPLTPHLSPALTPILARRLPDHRSRYLDHEGPIADPPAPDRGSVESLAAAPARVFAESPIALDFACALSGRFVRYHATPDPDPPRNPPSDAAPWLVHVRL